MMADDMMADDGAPRDMPMDPACLPPVGVETIRDARVIPMGPGRDMPAGVFRPDGSFVEASRTLISARRLSGTPDLPQDEALRPLAGRHLYAGVGRHHFGHFLMEGIGRLWAMEQAHKDVEGVLVLPMHDKDIEAVIHRRLLPLYSLLCYGKPIWLIDHPAHVEELLVPTPGFGHLHWSTATPEFRAFVRGRVSKWLVPDGPEKVYISRTRLKSVDQQMDQEEELEGLLEKAGYEIFHPQHHSLEDQCRIYATARRILGPDGSAFHLAPFALQDGAHVGLIQRRHRRPLIKAIANQIRSFADVELQVLNPLLPVKTHATPPGQPDRIDLKLLIENLRDTGFL